MCKLEATIQEIETVTVPNCSQGRETLKETRKLWLKGSSQQGVQITTNWTFLCKHFNVQPKGFSQVPLSTDSKGILENHITSRIRAQINSELHERCLNETGRKNSFV